MLSPQPLYFQRRQLSPLPPFRLFFAFTPVSVFAFSSLAVIY